MNKGPGLVQEDCKHERQEYNSMAWREEIWRCLDCGETLTRPIDALGG